MTREKFNKLLDILSHPLCLFKHQFEPLCVPIREAKAIEIKAACRRCGIILPLLKNAQSVMVK